MQDEERAIKYLARDARLPDPVSEMLMTTKADLVAEIKLRKQEILQSLLTNDRHTLRYYNVLSRILDEFIGQVEDTVLPHALEEWWAYSFEITFHGAAVTLHHLNSVLLDTKDHRLLNYSIDQSFVLIHTDARMLSVEEYADLYGVEPVTVRQWIRRTKLREVEKLGRREWGVSELADTPARGYESATYTWKRPLAGIPEGFEYLNHYRTVTISKLPRKDLYELRLGLHVDYDYRGGDNTRQITDTERETLERFLMFHDDVRYSQKSEDYFFILKLFRKGQEIDGVDGNNNGGFEKSADYQNMDGRAADTT